MAARRLLIVMLILLGISTLAAALVPPLPEREGTTDSTTSPRTSPIPRGGELVKARIDADSKKPERIRLPLGDQLALIVSSRKATQVEIRRLGLLEDVLTLSPARFDILATREGRFPIRRIEPDKELGVISVPRDR